jgi:hypothetical protein
MDADARMRLLNWPGQRRTLVHLWKIKATARFFAAGIRRGAAVSSTTFSTLRWVWATREWSFDRRGVGTCRQKPANGGRPPCHDYAECFIFVMGVAMKDWLDTRISLEVMMPKGKRKKRTIFFFCKREYNDLNWRYLWFSYDLFFEDFCVARSIIVVGALN